MTNVDERLTGIEATQRLLAEAEREEFIDLALVARATGCDSRRIMRDWVKRRHYPVTRVGRVVKLSSALVLRAYFQHNSHHLR